MLVRTMKRHPWSVAAIALALAALAWGPRASAQCPVEPDRVFVVWQDGRMVGEIYRDDPDPNHYVEHWVLQPEYRDGVATEITPGGRQVSGGVKGFLATARRAPGTRYLKADCFDGASLPGR
jgi:hypothetical protein